MIHESYQPRYAKSIPKRHARLRNPKIYELLNGRSKLKDNEKYVTLANLQDGSKNSEINQLVRKKFLTKEQFVGIDNSKVLIRKNKKTHPQATWIFDDWCCALYNLEFYGGLVYFDSTFFGDRFPAVKALKATLSFADFPETLLVCNVMQTNPYNGLGKDIFDHTKLIQNLYCNDHYLKWRNWNRRDDGYFVVPSYEYKTTNKTLMRSYIFYNGPLSDDMIEKINLIK